MFVYHINPKTGRAGLCRAQKQCPFGGAEIHFETKSEANDYSLRSMPAVPSLKSNKLSAAGTLVLKLAKAQNVLIEKSKSGLDRADDKNFWKDIEVRNSFRDKLEKELPWDDSDAPAYDDSEVFSISSDFIETDAPRRGYSNDFLKFGAGEEEAYAVLDEASKLWLKRLSTAEVKAIVIYNFSADSYAKIQAGLEEPTEDDRLFVKYFHSALDKAPKTAKPYVVYSGVSLERQEDIASQAENGAIDLNRIQSASLNPAQVNQFSHYHAADGVVLELRLNRIASLSLFNIHRGEMEVLAPPGKYELSQKLTNVGYFWNEKSGREMGRVYQVDFTG